MNIWSGSWGLGDILLMTAPCKYRNDITVILPKNQSRYSFIFDDIANVQLVDTPPSGGCGVGDGTFVERLLRYCGLEGVDTTPQIKVKQEYIDKAKDLIKDIHNPIIFKPTCSKHWAHIRQPSTDYWNLSSEYTNILCGTSDNDLNFNGIKLLDLDLQTLSGLYSIVGKYVGVDTGDMHLMLAVGGVCEVHVPPSGNEYNHNEWHYRNDRVRYVQW